MCSRSIAPLGLFLFAPVYQGLHPCLCSVASPRLFLTSIVGLINKQSEWYVSSRCVPLSHFIGKKEILCFPFLPDEESWRGMASLWLRLFVLLFPFGVIHLHLDFLQCLTYVFFPRHDDAGAFERGGTHVFFLSLHLRGYDGAEGEDVA